MSASYFHLSPLHFLFGFSSLNYFPPYHYSSSNPYPPFPPPPLFWLFFFPLYSPLPLPFLQTFLSMFFYSSSPNLLLLSLHIFLPFSLRSQKNVITCLSLFCGFLFFSCTLDLLWIDEFLCL